MNDKGTCVLTIIIPVYNAEKTIVRALESLKKISVVSRRVVEVFIIDDGSTDSSASVAESKIEGLSPMEVHFIRQENTGPSGARNAALEQAKGRWVFFLDSDDELAFDPIPLLEHSTEFTALVFPVRLYRNSRPRGVWRPTLITPRNHLDKLTASNPNHPTSTIFKRDRMRTNFDPDYRYLEDWLFWLTNPGIFENVHLVKDIFSTTVHIHGGNLTSHYAKMGFYRTKVAEKILAEFGEGLSGKQRNNLFIQADIGRIRQGMSPGLGAFSRLPCNVKLYMKLIVHYILRGRFSKIDVYGQ